MSTVRIPVMAPNVDTAYRRQLADQIFRLLKSNGADARGVYDGLDALPKGGMRQLYLERPFDGMRCEIGGTTLTVEITNQRVGEQDEPDQLRFATYDYAHFRAWFFSLLLRSGITPQPPAAQGVPADLLPIRKIHGGIRPDLRSTPPIRHRSPKGGRR